MATKLIFVVILCTIGIQAKVSYEQYKIYDVLPNSNEQADIVRNLAKNGYELWTDVVTVNRNASVMISPSQETEFLEYTKNMGMTPKLRIPNLQSLIDAQLVPSTSKSQRNNLGSLTWEKYYNLEEIHAWLDELQVLFPNVVTTITIGQTLERRDIKGIIIDFKAGNRGDKPLAGMIEGGIHAREWISPATVTWIIKEFLTSQEPDVRFMAETFVWHIFPVINPDGYVYTFDGNRMWRKNRNPANFGACGANNDLSNGIDLNRNFDFLWMSVGATQYPCDQTYAGQSAGSELETQAISKYVLQLKQDYNMIYYFAFHSYSQMILIPYSHVKNEDVLEASNYGDLFEIAIRGSEKLTARHGTRYTVGTSATILYEVSGSSMDWAKGIADIPIAYLFEVRDLGSNGFLLPPNEIIPNGEEIMDCLLEMNRVTHELGYFHASGSSSIIASLTTVCICMMLLFFR